MTEPRITPVPPAFVDCVWDEILPFVAAAVATSGGAFTAASVYDDAKSGFHTLWIIIRNDAIVMMLTTRIVQYPAKRALAIDWVGGADLRAVIEVGLDTLKEYARDNSCHEIEGCGRKGWEKWLAPHGWTHQHVAYKLEIHDEV
jgi:hypothetical protein